MKGEARPVWRIYLCNGCLEAHDHGKRVVNRRPHNSGEHITHWAFLLASCQKLIGPSAFALAYRLLLRSCKLLGAFLISPLPPFCWNRYKQQGSLAPRALPRFFTTMSPSETLSSSTAFLGAPVIRLPCSAAFATGRGGFLQLLRVSLPSCCR